MIVKPGRLRFVVTRDLKHRTGRSCFLKKKTDLECTSQVVDPVYPYNDVLTPSNTGDGAPASGGLSGRSCYTDRTAITGERL